MPANLAVGLPPDLKATLDAYSERTGVPRAVIVARLLAKALHGEATALPPVVAADRTTGQAALTKLRRRGMGVDRG